MSGLLEFRLNGEPVQLDSVSPNTTLLEWLRGRGLTGSKEGCAEGDCGACSVAIVDLDSRGNACYRAINSCLVPVSLLAGREVISVEGVAFQSKIQNPKSIIQTRQTSSQTGAIQEGELHPVQEKMVECHGSQCGYCTPGFILSLFEGYYRGDISKSDQLDDQLCGNLCRCTGYRSIRQAALEAFPERHGKNGADAFAERLKKPGPDLAEVEYAFAEEKFLRPISL